MAEFKVFVGNLSYAVTKENLEELFNPIAKVVDVQLISRYGRSKGFGFVSFESEQDCDKIVAKFHQYEYQDRPMNVETARPKVETEDRPKKKPVNKKAPKEDAERTERPKAERSEKPKAEPKPKAERSEKPRAEPKPKAERSEKPENKGQLSATMVFVGNLPFKVSGTDLEELFKDYSVASARIVKGKFGRSKGYGFVDFNSPQHQQKALDEFKDAVVDGRVIALKPAYSVAAE